MEKPAPVERNLTQLLVGKSGPGAPGDWKVARTRRQECRRYVAQAFQPAGSGDFPVPSFESVKMLPIAAKRSEAKGNKCVGGMCLRCHHKMVNQHRGYDKNE